MQGYGALRPFEFYDCMVEAIIAVLIQRSECMEKDVQRYGWVIVEAML